MPSSSLRSTCLILSLLVSLTVCGDEPEKAAVPDDGPGATKLLTWHGSLAPAVEEARRRKTSILVRVGAAWCGWCRRLDKEIEKPDVQKELAGWTLVELDADNDPDEVRRLSVGPIPALRVLNTSGRPVRSHDGYLPADELILWLRGQDAETPDEMLQELSTIPELDASTVGELARLLAHKEANVREAVARRLAANKGLAGAEVAKVFIRGRLGARLAALDLLIDWQAPVKDIDPWQPQTITAERLNDLEDWAASLSSGETESTAHVEPLTAEQLTEAKAEISKLSTSDPAEVEAIGARLARWGDRLLPLVRDQRQQAETDSLRERLDWLRYRLVASDALMLKWPGGLMRLAATDARLRHAAASELPDVVTHGDESLLIELFSHPDSFVRELTLKALHGVGGQRSSSELTKLLSDPEPNVRAAVLKQMAEKPSPKLVPQISEYIARETDPDLIVHAVRLLREIKNKDSVECLMKLFAHSSWQVRAEAVDAVGETVSQRIQARYGGTKLDASVGADAYTAILEVLADSDGFVVSRAVNALKDADLAIAAAPLAKAAEKQPDLAVVVSEALTYGSNIKAKGKPLLRGWLKHEHENLRAAALKSLYRIGELDEATELIPALSDPSEKVRIGAAEELLQICEAKRPAKAPRPKKETAEVADAPAIEQPPSDSVLSQAARALGSLFQRPATAVAEPKSDPSKQDSTTGDAKQEADAETRPYEKWLQKFRAGKGRLSWMISAVEPLNVMQQSMSTHERVASGQALVALGHDDPVLESLLQLAQQQPSLVIPVSKTLCWLPWNRRIDTFQKLQVLAADSEQLGQICEQLVVLRDTRAADPLWDVLADKRAGATLATSVFANLLTVHGLVMQYGYIDTDQSTDPIGFQSDRVQNMVLKSEHAWQRRVALALLLQFDKPGALEAAGKLIEDEHAPPAMRTDAFIARLLASDDQAEAERTSIQALKDRNPVFSRPALKYLTAGESALDSFADGQFHLPNTTHQVVRLGNDSDNKKLPKGLKAEHLEGFLTDADGDLAAGAAYLMAMLGDPLGLDRLIAQWRSSGAQSHGEHSWEKLTYEAIAASNEARFVPVLAEIYQSMRSNRPYELRQFYWSIRSMTGPEVLKLRKQMRDEVGMDQLR